MDKKYLLENCKYCGDKGLLKIVGSYKQHFTDYDGDEPVFHADTLWRMLECPVCNKISLHRTYSDDSMFVPEEGYFSDESIEYPGNRYDFSYVPESILKSYQAAIKTSKVDLSAVSYTHLDVYKRQVYNYSYPSQSGFRREAVRIFFAFMYDCMLDSGDDSYNSGLE